MSSRWMAMALVLLAASEAGAQGLTEEDRKRASNYFDAGAQAYAAGAYLVSAEAFLEAHAVVPQPALLFSAAQAYRRQHLLTPSRAYLDKAVQLYRRYLSSPGDLKRRDDAMEGLEDLVAMQSRLPADVGEGPDTSDLTRILVTAAAPGARVSLDGAAFVPAPLVAETSPGPHRVRVEAPNHRASEVTVTAVEGDLVPQAVALTPKPARLVVKGSPGELRIDGEAVADVPTEIDVTPGARFVAVVAPGYAPYSTRASFTQGAGYTLDITLTPTPQRVASWSLLGLGGAAVLTGGTLAAVAFIRQGDAIALRDARTAGGTSVDDLAEYRDAVADRDDFGAAAAITGGLGGAALLSGLLLYALDPAPRVLPPDDADPADEGEEDFTVGLGPAGVVLRGRF